MFRSSPINIADEKALVFQALSAYLTAKTPVHESVAFVLNGWKLKGKVAKILKGVRQDIQPGKPLSQILDSHPDLVNESELALINKAEAYDSLPEVLDFLSDKWEHKAQELRWKRGILNYPLFLMFVMFAAFNFFGFFILPRFHAAFASFSQELPPLTQGMMGFFNFYQYFWWLLIPIVVMSILCVKSRHPSMVTLRQRMETLWPKRINAHPHRFVTRFSQLLGRLVTQDIGTLKAAEMAMLGAARSSSDLISLQRLTAPQSSVEVLCREMEKSGLFPTNLVHFIQVGEHSGTLPKLMDKVAQAHNRQAQCADELNYTLWRTFLYLIAAGLGGIMILSVFMPIFNIGGMF